MSETETAKVEKPAGRLAATASATLRPDLAPALGPALGLAALAGLALLARLYNIGGPSLWHDEVYSVYVAGLPLDRSLEYVRTTDLHPPLYYVLLRPFLSGGDNAFIFRLFSTLLNLACLLPFFFMARRFVGRTATWVSLLLFALSPLHVFYSQMVRMYALMALLALLSCYLFWKLLDEVRPAWPVWAGYVVSTTLMFYTQYMAVMYLAAQGLALLALFRRRPLILRAVSAWAAVGLGLLPLVPTMLQQAGASTSYARPDILFLLDSYLAFGAADRAYNGQPFALLAILQPYLGFGLLLLAYLGWRKMAGLPRERTYLLIFWLVPLALCWLVSQVKPVYADRAFLASSFAFLALLGAAFRDFRWPRRREETLRSLPLLAAATLTLILTLAALWLLLNGSLVRNDLRGLARDAAGVLQAEDQSGPRLLLQFNENATFIYDYYLPPGAPRNQAGFPAEAQRQLEAGAGRVCAIHSVATRLLPRAQADLDRFRVWLAARPNRSLLSRQYPDESLRLDCWSLS